MPLEVSDGLSLYLRKLGRKARPILRPDQSQVDLYGATFTRGHPANSQRLKAASRLFKTPS
jgi:hypothetical protein